MDPPPPSWGPPASSPVISSLGRVMEILARTLCCRFMMRTEAPLELPPGGRGGHGLGHGLGHYVCERGL